MSGSGLPRIAPVLSTTRTRASANLYLDRLALAVFGFRYAHLQHAVFAFGRDLVGVYVLRQCEAARKRAVEALDAQIVRFARFLLVLPTPRNVRIPSSTVTSMSSFLTSGNSALIRYSCSVSLMFATGRQVRSPSVGSSSPRAKNGAN